MEKDLKIWRKELEAKPRWTSSSVRLEAGGGGRDEWAGMPRTVNTPQAHKRTTLNNSVLM